MKRTLRLSLVSLGGAVIIFSVVILSVGMAQPASADIATCPMFPADNVWNARVDTLPVDSHSAAYINSIGASVGVHPDFGSGTWNGGPIGIPYALVSGTQPPVAINYTAYGDESDPGPFPIPANAPIEGGAASDGDRHVLVIDSGNCMLYELYRAFPQANGSWNADSGAKYDLRSNAFRSDTWTSADAAGLPIFAGLARYDEVSAGVINHALRFTAPRTQKKHIWPARHDASSITDVNYPPMGQRFRLKASFDISSYPHDVQIILTALKTYGMILADNGSSWFISGAPDERWNNDELVGSLRNVHGSDFEAVDESGLMVDPNSGQVRGAPVTPTATQVVSPTNTPTRINTATPKPTSTATKTPSPCAVVPAKPALVSPQNGAALNVRRVLLDWTDVGCAARYEVQVRQNSQSGSIVDNSSTLTTSQYTTLSLATNKNYYWRVRACNARGCSAWTGQWWFKVRLGAQ